MIAGRLAAWLGWLARWLGWVCWAAGSAWLAGDDLPKIIRSQKKHDLVFIGSKYIYGCKDKIEDKFTEEFEDEGRTRINSPRTKTKDGLILI